MMIRMGMFDDLKKQAEKAVSEHPELREKAEKYLEEHPETVERISDQVIERGGDAVDSATGGRYAAGVDKVQRAADERIGE